MSNDSVAQDQIRAFVDRILRLKEEKAAIGGDIREVYAEAKGNGFDKTVLGKLVSYIEKRAAGAADLAESEALFDLYLSAYDGASHTHAREDDEIPGNGAGSAEAGVEVALVASASANSSTAARKDVRTQGAEERGGETAFDDGHDVVSIQKLTPKRGSQLAAGHATLDEDVPAGLATGNLLAGTQAPPVETIPEPVADDPADPLRSGAATRKDAGTPAQEPTNVLQLRKYNPETHFLNSAGLERLHGCQRPDACAGSWRALCHGCAPRETGEVA